MSLATLEELSEVLARPRLRKYTDEEDARRFLAAITLEAEWVETTTGLKASRDPKDDKFLELAVSGNATHLVTGDKDLLVLHPFRGIQIVTPDAFLNLG